MTTIKRVLMTLVFMALSASLTANYFMARSQTTIGQIELADLKH